MAGTGSFDLDAYLERIGYSGPREPTLPTLEAMHLGHLARIPFENVDVRLGRPIRIDLESLQAKLVRAARGGYCFEQNTVFAAALRAIGFDVATLEARVRPPDAPAVLPRTHMLLRVAIGGTAWLADVGFGGDGPFLPVPLDGSVSVQIEGAYRVAPESSEARVLRRRWRGVWRDLYAFTLVPALPVDFEVANHFTSTHPASVFLRTLTIQRSDAGVRHMLRDRVYTVRRADDETARAVPDEEIPGLLRGPLGLDLPDEVVRRALGERDSGPGVS